MSKRQRSTKTAKYKISYSERLAVFNNEQISTLQGDLYMAPEQTKTNVSISTPDQEIERPYSRQKTFNKKEFMWKDKFSFYFPSHFTLIKWGRFLDFTGA